MLQRVLAIFLCALFSLGFIFPQKKDWKQGVQKVGIRVRLHTPELQVCVARNAWLGLGNFNEKDLEKDENLNARMDIALKDFSFPDVIFEEFKMAFDRFTSWSTVPEKEFEAQLPDLILDVEVLGYGLSSSLIDSRPSVYFCWQIKAVKPQTEEVLWIASRKKVSSSRHLIKWMSDKADMLKGELRAHILFAVQDLMKQKKMRTKKKGSV